MFKSDKVKEAPRLKGYKGLGLVDFIVFPHWGSDKQKNDYQYMQIEDGWYRMIDVKNKLTK